MKILTRAGRLCSDHVCRLFFFLATLLFCESTHVLAQITAIWTGSGGDSNYNTAANWDIAQVPINNLIDDFIVVIPASHTVNFNVPGTGHKVFQLSLADNATLNINSGRDLAVVDEASVAGILTTDNGVFSAPSLASRFDGTRGRIEITGGGDITLNATSYSSLGLNGTATLFSADGTGTVLNLSSVQSINAGWDDFSGGSRVNTIRATNNAAINLSGVETINAPSRGEDRIDFVVGANSTINLSGLTTTTSASGGDTRFDVQAANFSLPALLNASNTQFDVAAGSTLDLPMLVTHNLGTYQIRAASVVTANDLTSLNNVDLTIDPDGTFNAEDLTDFQGSSVTLSPSRTFNTGVLSNIDNAQFFVEGGLEYGTAQGEVSATSYSSLGLNGTATLFSADGTGTVLNLSSVQSINAGWDDFSGGSRVNTIRATNNAAINLSGVETINAPSRGEDRIDFVVETGGSIDLESLHLITNASSGQTRFTIGGAGSIKIGDLNAAENATFTVNDLNSNLDVDGSFNVDSGSVTVGAGASIEVSKSYSFGMTTESSLNLDSGVLRFDGIGGQQMEVGGEDAGVGGFMSGNFGMGQLRIGTTTQRTSVDLLDVIDNGNRGGGGEAEALYLFGLGGPAGLRILNNSALVLNGINVYAWDPVAGSQVHLNSLFNPGELRIPYDDGFLQLAPLDFQWDNNAGGDFNLGGNWSDGLVPLGSDSAIWNLGSVAGYTVQFGTNVATDSAIIKSDTVNFDLGGFQYSLAALNATTGLVIGQDTIDNAKLTISNGTLHSKDVRIAAAAGSQGILTIGPSGSLQVDSDVVLGVGSGTLRVIPANQVNVGGNVIISGDSRLEGGGLIATLVENQTGTLAPGVSAGIMSLNANYTQQSTGKLEIEIGGVDNSNANAPQFDQLIVSGSANLAGGLAVSLIDAGAGLFVPNDGDFFEIVSASAELATSFTNLTLPALVDDSWLMGQFGNSLFLRVAENLADFDGDLDVDGRDFTLWQRGFGITSGATKANGDSNGDGAVDAADLDNWKIQYGYQIVGGGSPFSSTVAVPEPAGLSFLLLGMLGLTGSARFWRP
ncbi:hypothetical protein [Bythopirellula polymerisocia]|uniref:PEP-CTERM protein-sorting domain-containing protein n=1 Tax=Bythopirellula polymerisocia TaxID=2528003 RepID=A0A5C6CSH6_9BACT|nr:hypothetical protein [Bythopirellula polymerisocia]TWU27462.1 hypothetical protein Pla144_22350 [Bythopirellula polymerisocia]